MSGSDETSGRGRLATGRARLASERTRLAGRLDDARHHSGFVDGLARAWEHDSEVGGGLLAGALAFRLFMFMVPFTLVAFTLLGLTAEAAESSPGELANQAGISGVLAQGIFTTSDLTATHQVVLLLVGGYALIRTSSSVVATIVAASCLAWRMAPVKVKPLKPALLFIAFVLVTAVLTSYLGRLRSAAPAPGMALTIAWLLVPLLTWWWAEAHLPHGDAPIWALLPGAVVFALGIQALHLFTALWVVRSVGNKSETYGVIGVALSVLAWAYVAGRLVSSTAVVNAALWRRFQERHPEAVEAAAAGGEAGLRAHVRLGLAWARSAAGLLR